MDITPQYLQSSQTTNNACTNKLTVCLHTEPLQERILLPDILAVLVQKTVFSLLGV